MIEPYLYLLIRNDLDSLNPGKAVAHGAHAANQFVFENGWRPDRSPVEGLEQWEASTADGFGTTIALSVTLRELQTAVQIARLMGFAAGETFDPTYPYILHREYAGLIEHPEDCPPMPISDDKMLCLRREITAGYVFGDKTALKPILANFPLMP